MSTKSHTILFSLALLILGGFAVFSMSQGDAKTAAYALGCIVALFIRPPQLPSTVPAASMIALLMLTGCEANYRFGVTHFLGFRASSIEMTPQASNPTPSGVGGIYTKNSDNLPRFVDTSGNEYRAGDAKHIVISAGTPGGAVLGDCWIDSTDGNRLYCKEDAGDLPQRTDLNDPGPIGGVPFEAAFARTCTLTSAAAITPVNCLSNADVPLTKKAYLLGWHAKINGATAWATTANCWIQDTSGTNVIFVTTAVAAMTGNAFLVDGTANVSQQAPYSLGTGGTADLGLEVACNANGTGSNWVVTVYGVIR